MWRKCKIRLDSVLHHLLDVLQIEIRCRVGHQIGHGVKHRRIRETRSLEGIIDRMQRRQIIEAMCHR